MHGMLTMNQTVTRQHSAGRGQNRGLFGGCSCGFEWLLCRHVYVAGLAYRLFDTWLGISLGMAAVDCIAWLLACALPCFWKE
jgi:hypothetical protein